MVSGSQITAALVFQHLFFTYYVGGGLQVCKYHGVGVGVRRQSVSFHFPATQVPGIKPKESGLEANTFAP